MTQTTDPEDEDYSFLQGGLLHRLMLKAGLAKTGVGGVRIRVIGLVCVTYVPILILALFQGVLINPGIKIPFLYDIAEICRFLIVGPLLMIAEVIIEPWLLQVVKHVRDRLLPKENLLDYQKLIAGAVRWRDSSIVEIVLFLAVFAWKFIEIRVTPMTATTSWHQLPSTDTQTYAWFWYSYFAKPLIRFLWLRWLWRYLIWSVFLCRLASLPLKIVPTHPDRRGGLQFIAVGHGRFAALAFAFGVQASSVFGTHILFDGKTLTSFKYEIAAVVAISLVMFLTPLMAFTGKLMNAKRIGLFDYGALANEYTEEFHAKWISGSRGDEKLLGTPDLQSLADLDSSYSVVCQMTPCLIGKSNITAFAVASLLPFAPLILTVYPFDELIKHLIKAVM